jgi:hypothetical protein
MSSPLEADLGVAPPVTKCPKMPMATAATTHYFFHEKYSSGFFTLVAPGMPFAHSFGLSVLGHRRNGEKERGRTGIG